MNKERMIENFFEMVKIPSESEKDLEFLKFLEGYFKDMGAEVKRDTYGNLVAKFAAKNSDKTESVAFGCHSDTVQPGVGIEPYIDGDVIRSKGDTILAADDKAGIAEIIEGIRNAEKHPPIEVVITRNEEIGTLGSKNLDYSLLSSKIAYILDAEAANEAIIGGPSYYTFDVTYKGRTAHAGMEPEKGISAIQAASYAINKMKLGRLDDESTANIGVISGGLVRNSIPDKCCVVGETRSKTHEKCEKNAQIMEDIFNEANEKFGTEIELKKELSMNAYKIGTDTKVYQIAEKAFKDLGVTLEPEVITGGTDATMFNEKGIATMVLGNASRDIHSTDEHAIIKEMEIIANAVTNILHDLA